MNPLTIEIYTDNIDNLGKYNLKLKAEISSIKSKSAEFSVEIRKGCKDMVI